MKNYFLFAILSTMLLSTNLNASGWSAPEEVVLGDEKVWITLTPDIHENGAGLGYICTDSCVAFAGLPIDCNEGISTPVLVSLEWTNDQGRDGVYYGSLQCSIEKGNEDDRSFFTVLIFEDGEDNAEEMIALADRIGIALALTDDLRFQAYRFNLDGSFKAMANALNQSQKSNVEESDNSSKKDTVF